MSYYRLCYIIDYLSIFHALCADDYIRIRNINHHSYCLYLCYFMAFIILYTHLQLGHSVPSSMWMTQHNAEDEPFSVFRGIPPFSLTPSPWVILSSVSGYFCPRPCSQPLVFSIQLIFCLPLLATPWLQTLKLLVPFQSPLPGAALALTTLEAVFPASSLCSLWRQSLHNPIPLWGSLILHWNLPHFLG